MLNDTAHQIMFYQCSKVMDHNEMVIFGHGNVASIARVTINNI